MRPFLCEFQGAEENPDKENQKQKWCIKIENVLYGKQNANKMDVKLGKSTVTKSIASSELKLKKRLLYDQKTTSPQLGFVICGTSYKDPITGKPINGGKKGHEDEPKNEAESMERISYFF